MSDRATPVSGSRDTVTRAGREFAEATAGHRMRVLLDDGLYRHLRFNTPGSWIHGYDLVTWPGYLMVTGDMGDWAFERDTDMFTLFRRNDPTINPDYWSGKLRAGSSGAELSRRFSTDRLRTVAEEWWDDVAEGLGGRETVRLREELDDHLRLHGPSSVDSAIACLASFEFEGRDGYGHPTLLGCEEPWHYDFTDYDPRFLWICWAIVQGIAQYDWAKGWR